MTAAAQTNNTQTKNRIFSNTRIEFLDKQKKQFQFIAFFFANSITLVLVEIY